MEIEQTHLEDFNIFNKTWDERMNALEQKIKEDEETLLTQHSNELTSDNSQSSRVIADKSKASADVLNLEKILKNLIKQQK